MTRIAILLFLLFTTSIGLVVSDQEIFIQITGYPSWRHLLSNNGNHLALGTAGHHDEVQVEINPPLEFDNLSREKILGLRTAQVTRYSSLLSKNYSPDIRIFGQIEDGKPWWGLHGIYSYGPGQRGIDGLSEESRFILNPFLIIGLVEPSAYITRQDPDFIANAYPRPVDLMIDLKNRKGRVKYNVSTFFTELKTRNLGLVTLNSQDFGMNWMYPDYSRSSFAVLRQNPENPIQLKQYIHNGRSCGYPGGCNNLSPSQPELAVRVEKLPAQMAIKLWRRFPSSPASDGDFLFVIEMH